MMSNHEKNRLPLNTIKAFTIALLLSAMMACSGSDSGGGGSQSFNNQGEPTSEGIIDPSEKDSDPRQTVSKNINLTFEIFWSAHQPKPIHATANIEYLNPNMVRNQDLLLEDNNVVISGNILLNEVSSLPNNITITFILQDGSTALGSIQNLQSLLQGAFQDNSSNVSFPVIVIVEINGVCGNGILQGDEECDDGNNHNEDSCLNNCIEASCGDGFTNPLAEECDDGNSNNNDNCTNDCLFPVATCGDGVIQTGEDCDDGNRITEACNYGETSCFVCASNCSTQAGITSYCGDEVIQQAEGETCEDGNTISGDGCDEHCRGEVKVVQVAAADTSTCVLFETGEVRCWGKGNYGQLGYGNTTDIGDNEYPADAGNVFIAGGTYSVSQISGGSYHHCALLNDGGVRCWGYGIALGYGDIINIGSVGDDELPAYVGDVPFGGTATSLASGGSHHGCVVLDTGALRCWGFGHYGVLGHNSPADIGVFQIPAVAGDIPVGEKVTQAAIGTSHTCALLETGKVRCWGFGPSGVLGYEGYNDPLYVADGSGLSIIDVGDINLGATAVQITAGGYHNCALLDSGKVRCWGEGSRGQLGYGNTNSIGDDESPASAGDVPVGGPVVQIAAGGSFTCALLATGSVRCWGSNQNGELGYGHTQNIGDDETPASVGDVPIGGIATQITTSAAHTCALLTTGTVRCWGNSAYGPLGYHNQNNIGDNETPADIGDVPVGFPDLTPPINPADCGNGFLDFGEECDDGNNSIEACAYGDIHCYICNAECLLEEGETSYESRRVLEVQAGGFHTCALLDTGANPGAVRCWGNSDQGQLGYGNMDQIGDDETLETLNDIDLGNTAIQVATGGLHNCALFEDGSVRCWGFGHFGRLGNGSLSDIGDDETPAMAPSLFIGDNATELSAGTAHSCALFINGTVKCWGYGDTGALGYGNTSNIISEAEMDSAGDVSVGGSVQQVSVGTVHTCALLDSGTVRCWGKNYSGQLGYGHTNNIGDNELPSSVGTVSVGGTVDQIASGGFHTCALLDNGTVRCWGRNALGELGYGHINNIGDDETPDSAGDVSVGGLVTQIVAGSNHTCVLLTTGAVRCWGKANFGQLGYGDINNIGDDETPASAGDVPLGGKVLQITAGEDHTCALLETEEIKCWGWNEKGQLGYGDTENIGDDEIPSAIGVIPFFSIPIY